MLAEVLKRIGNSSSITDLNHITCDVSKFYGMDGFYYANVSPLTGFQFIDHRPTEWLKHYEKQGYLHFDVITQTAFSQKEPFLWEKAINYSGISKSQKMLLLEARDFGLNHGYNVLSHGEGYDRATCCFYSSDRSDFMASLREFKPELDSLAHAVHEKYVALQSPWPDAPVLSPREIECLKWAAIGMSNTDIGDILSLSSNTVGSYMQSSEVKLGVRTKIHAIVKAIQLNIIKPF